MQYKPIHCAFLQVNIVFYNGRACLAGTLSCLALNMLRAVCMLQCSDLCCVAVQKNVWIYAIFFMVAQLQVAVTCLCGRR